MDITVTKREEKSQVEMEISIPAGDFKPYIDRAAKELTKDKPLKGFRPGKAPAEAVAAALGHERLLKEAMEKAMPKFFVNAVIEENIEAINRPSVTIKKLGMDEPFEFTAIVDVLPEVTIEDLKTMKSERKKVEVTDKDIEKELEYLAKMRASAIDVTRPAQEGDTVTVDFEVKINGVLIEGGESKNHPVNLGEGHFVPDFEKKLTGISAGDERDFTIEFPDDFAKEEYRGKKAEVHAKAHSVQKRVPPKIDDEFAKSLGEFKSLNELKEKLRENIKNEREHKEQERVRGELMNQLAEAASFGFIPEVLIEREIDQRIAEFEQMLAMQQRTMEEYLTGQSKTAEDMRADMKEAAEKNVKVSLAMRAFADKHDVKVTPEEIEEKAKEHLAQFPDQEEAAKHIDPEAMRDEISALLRNQKTLEKLEEVVNGGEVI